MRVFLGLFLICQRKYRSQHNQCDIRAAHEWEVECNTAKYTTPFLCSVYSMACYKSSLWLENGPFIVFFFNFFDFFLTLGKSKFRYIWEANGANCQVPIIFKSCWFEYETIEKWEYVWSTDRQIRVRIEWISNLC